MKLSEAIELYNAKNRLLNILKAIQKYSSELDVTDALYGFRREQLLTLYHDLFKEVDYENIIQQKINAIDILLDKRYEGIE